MVNRITREERDQGFTLIELLAVIIVIGILSAIAVPVFLSQRGKATDSSVKADLHNASLAVESYATQYPAAEEVYIDDLYSNGFRESQGNVIAVTGGPAVGYCLYGYNESGSSYVSADTALTYDSLAGGIGQSGAACTGHPDLAVEATPATVQVVVAQISADAKASWYNADFFAYVEVYGGNYVDGDGNLTAEGLSARDSAFAGIQGLYPVLHTDTNWDGGRIFVEAPTKTQAEMSAEYNAAVGGSDPFA